MVRDLRVCFLGDSFVAGVGDPDHLGWVGRVAARTHQSGQALTAYALGVRGQTTPEVAGRWVAECGPRLLPGCDGRIVVSVGVNDTTMEGAESRVAAAVSVLSLRHLVRAVRAATWPLLVVGPPPVHDREQNERIEGLTETFGSVCRDAGVSYVPVFEELLSHDVWMRQVKEGDGAHPGSDGYEALAELIWPSWNNWIQTWPGSP